MTAFGSGFYSSMISLECFFNCFFFVECPNVLGIVFGFDVSFWNARLESVEFLHDYVFLVVLSAIILNVTN